MNDSQIRQLIRSEIYRSRQVGSFNLQSVNRHEHNGVSSNPINQSDIVPGLKVEGRVSFAQQTTYTIGLNFNPSSVAIQGIVTGSSLPQEKFIIVANAQFGPSYYMQPQSITSTVIGGPQQSIIQSSTYWGTDSGGGTHLVADEGHICDVEYGGSIHARATIISYNSSALMVTVDNLDSGWEITLSFTVT